MNESELRNLLPPERSLPADRSRAMETRLMTRIDSRDDTDAADVGEPPDGPVITLADAASPRAPGRGRRRLAGAAVAVIVAGSAIGGALALRDERDPDVTAESGAASEADAAPPDSAPERDLPPVVVGATPDPAHVARIAEVFSARSVVHTPGWRWALRAENVRCTFPDGSREDTIASEFPMEHALTADHLVQECSQGNDGARSVGGFDGTDAQVCVGGDAYPTAAVTLDGRSCEAVDPGLRPMTDADLVELNRMRAVEAAMLADPLTCVSEEQSAAWAEHVAAAAGVDLEVEITPQMPDGTPAPPGMTPPDSMVMPVPPGPDDPELEPGERVPTTVITADDVPTVCFVARVDWIRPIVEIQGGWARPA